MQFFKMERVYFVDRILCLKQEHRELAREAVRKSLVLLKNGKYANKPLLPLPKKASKVLVAGSHADNLGNQCGGWTITWQGLSGSDLTTGKHLMSTEVTSKSYIILESALRMSVRL